MHADWQSAPSRTPLHAACQQLRFSVVPVGAKCRASGDVMRPLGALSRTASGVLNRTGIEAQARVDVVPCTPRTRARSDQYNPEAEHTIALMSPLDAERDADGLFDEMVPYAGLGAEVQVSDMEARLPLVARFVRSCRNGALAARMDATTRMGFG